MAFKYIGNIDIYNRPIVMNPDGKISTVRSMSFEDDYGKQVVIPTVSDDGRFLSRDEAIELYYRTGKHLGKLDTVDEAIEYAEQLHLQQDSLYGDRGGMTKHPLNEQGFKLDDTGKLQLGLSALGDFMTIIPTLSAANAKQSSYDFQAWQSNKNAELLRLDAQDILQQSYDYENKVREQGKRVRGEQIAAMSASGFRVESASYQGIIGETDYNIARNTAAIRREAMSKYASVNAKADMENIQADYYKKAGKLVKKRATNEALFSGMTGALKLGALHYFSKDTPVDVKDTARTVDNIRMEK